MNVCSDDVIPQRRQNGTQPGEVSCRSLCIIDEFGKGTLTTDGVGLLVAALRQLATAAEPPKVVAVTHFSELLNADYLPR